MQGIRDAKFLIWAAVAWFSNETIYRELLAKKEQGLNIQLIISDEESNSKLLSALQREFDVVVMLRHGWKDYNRMHVRYCQKRVVKNATASLTEDLLLVHMRIKESVFIMNCCKAVNDNWIIVRETLSPK